MKAKIDLNRPFMRISARAENVPSKVVRMAEPAATIALLVNAVMKSGLPNSASYHLVEKPSNGNDSEADE
ncbi:hypothetical protein D3C86_2201940 [compost metagenome]